MMSRNTYPEPQPDSASYTSIQLQIPIDDNIGEGGKGVPSQKIKNSMT